MLSEVLYLLLACEPNANGHVDYLPQKVCNDVQPTSELVSNFQRIQKSLNETFPTSSATNLPSDQDKSSVVAQRVRVFLGT